GLNVELLLTSRGTVFMLGAEDAQVAPLVTAFTGHLAREARRIAGTMPGGRLDPPLSLVLDEAALICPIPLDNWTADMGGRGVPVLSPAQIAQLPFRRVLIIRKGMPSAVGRVRMAWKRRDVRAARRSIRWTRRGERWATWPRIAYAWLTARMDTAATTRPVIQ